MAAWVKQPPSISARMCSRRSASSTDAAWAATVQKEADGGSLSGLDKQDIAALITLGEAFSSISRAAQADHARLTLRQMEARAADAEKALMGKGKLYSTLGVLAGFAAALMMI